MSIKLNQQSGVPIYLQIVQEIKSSVLFGSLQPGEKLQSVRELAIQLRVNPNTVARAYRELKYEGIIDSKWGGGNFIAEDVNEVSALDKRSIAIKELKKAVDNARELGFCDKDVIEMLKDILKL